MIVNIPKTKEELEHQVDALAKRLEVVGLSKYEARAYLGLIAHGFGPAETIANTARIPRTSAYKVLDSLCAKKFATATGGRPKIYKPEQPLKIQERLQDELAEIFGTIKMLSDIVNESGLPQLVYTITDEEKVIRKIVEIIDSSIKTVIIASPVFSHLFEYLQKPIQNALKRGVDVTVITQPSQRVPEKVKIIRSKNLLTTDLIADTNISLITSVDLSVCGYTDNEFISQQLQRFMNMVVDGKKTGDKE